MRWQAMCLGALVCLLATSAMGLTNPLPGAVPFPKGVKLVLPFPAGAKIRILSGYGPNMGSSLHKDTDMPSKANDHYALDLVYDDQPNAGKGLPIVAPLPGKVVRAGWATQGWANYGLRVILKHDLGDGHVYHSIYCHMDSVTVSEGSTVSVGQELGKLGQSCLEQKSCASFGTPHLHWSIHRDSSVGGSGTGGSYGGNAVVPEPFDGAEDLKQNMVITSTNSVDPKCGDGFCNGAETPQSCPQDCPVCQTIPPAGRVVDESEKLCFAQAGTPKYWHAEKAGHQGSLFWTTATDDPSPDNYGVWSFDFDQAGDYQVDVYTEGAFAQSKQARYQVRHAGATDEVELDQSAASGWQPLGSFYFAKGKDQRLRLDDNTGEPLSKDRKLAFDAVRLTGKGGSSSSSSSSGSTSSSSSSSSGGEGGEGGASTSTGPSFGGGGDDAGGGHANPDGVPLGLTGDPGCGCMTVGRVPQARTWLLFGALAFVLRQRRRENRAVAAPLL